MVAAFTCPRECMEDYQQLYDPDSPLCEGACITVVDTEFSLMFMGLAAFLLGMFAQMLFDRWWHLRMQIFAIMEEIKSITQFCCAFIRGTDARSVELKNNISRWCVLSLYLTEKQIDGKNNFRDAVERGLLTEEEWDALDDIPSNKYLPPLCWGLDFVVQSALEKRCAEFGGGGMLL